MKSTSKMFIITLFSFLIGLVSCKWDVSTANGNALYSIDLRGTKWESLEIPQTFYSGFIHTDHSKSATKITEIYIDEMQTKLVEQKAEEFFTQKRTFRLEFGKTRNKEGGYPYKKIEKIALTDFFSSMSLKEKIEGNQKITWELDGVKSNSILGLNSGIVKLNHAYEGFGDGTLYYEYITTGVFFHQQNQAKEHLYIFYPQEKYSVKKDYSSAVSLSGTTYTLDPSKVETEETRFQLDEVKTYKPAHFYEMQHDFDNKTFVYYYHKSDNQEILRFHLPNNVRQTFIRVE